MTNGSQKPRSPLPDPRKEEIKGHDEVGPRLRPLSQLPQIIRHLQFILWILDWPGYFRRTNVSHKQKPRRLNQDYRTPTLEFIFIVQ